MNLGEIFKNIDQFFSGKKTYLFILALGAFAFADIKDVIPLDLVQYKEEIYLGLLMGAGISLRQGIAKVGSK